MKQKSILIFNFYCLGLTKKSVLSQMELTKKSELPPNLLLREGGVPEGGGGR